MATYKPKRKTDSGVEEVLFPISAIEGLEEALNQGGGDSFTVDKITQVDTWFSGVESISDDGDGISWVDGVAFFGENDEMRTGTISHKIPICAGENITFSYDEENNAIAINATGGSGGGSTTTVSQVGTWLVIDEPEMPTKDLPLEFTSNGGSYMAIGSNSIGSSSWGINALAYQRTYGAYDTIYTNNPSGSYGITHGWADDNYRFITVTKEPTDAGAIAWLNNNTDAPKVELTEEAMPQIRFTSARGRGVDFEDRFSSEGSFYVGNEDEGTDYPVYLTVEIVSGKLQVGDQLQLCRTMTFMGSNANNHKAKIKLKRVAEYVATEDDLDRKFLTLTLNASMDGKVYRAFFRDGTGEGTPVNASPLYLRIRRPKGDLQSNDSGQTVDASFSNVITIWKRYHRGSGQIKFL